MILVDAATFLPQTLAAWAAIFAAVASGTATLVSLRNRQHIAEVHVLVNKNLQDVKDELAGTKVELNESRFQRNKLAGNAAYRRGLNEAQSGRVTGPR